MIIYLKGLNLLQLFLLLYKDDGTLHLQKIHMDSEVWFSKCPKGIRPYQQLCLLFHLPASAQYQTTLIFHHWPV
jgi:hypothetical protein